MVVIAHQVGVELVGLALEETVEAVEAPAERPLIEGPGGRALLHAGQVPLADAERGVAVVREHLRHRGRIVGDMPQHVGEPGAKVGNRPHADRVGRAAGQERRASGRAQRCGVEVGELQSPGRQRIDVGGIDVGPVATELGVAGVVEQHDHNVGRRVVGRRVVGRRVPTAEGVVGVWALVEVRLGLCNGAPDAPLKPGRS